MSKSINTAAIASLFPASAFRGGLGYGNGFNDCFSDMFGDGFGDVDINMSARGDGRGYDRYSSVYGYAAPYGNGAIFAPYAPVGPVVPSAQSGFRRCLISAGCMEAHPTPPRPDLRATPRTPGSHWFT